MPKELARRENLASQLDAACARLERQAKAQAARERSEYERKVAARGKRKGRAKGCRIKPPDDTPAEEFLVNLTDADGTQLLLGTRVSRCSSDRNELVADIDSVPTAVGHPAQVLADNGHATETEVAALSGRQIDVLVAVGTADWRRQHVFRPLPDRDQVAEPNPPKAPWLVAMQDKVSQTDNQAS